MVQTTGLARFLAALGCCACGTAAAVVRPDPAADLLFSRHLEWRGGDAAYSVALDGERVLWLFGDSWVGNGQPRSRAGRRLVRNSIGIQSGKDPQRARIEFHGAPFFDDGDADEQTWLWPGPAVMVEGRLLAFLIEVHSTGDGIWGFQAQGSRAALVDDLSKPPNEWMLRRVAAPSRPAGVELQGSALVENGLLYLFSVVEPGSHDVHVGRVPESQAAQGDLTQTEWFDGQRFGPAASSRPVLRGAQTEFSVHRSAAGPLWMIATNRLGSADIVVRKAPAPEGPWSDAEILFHPPEGDREQVFVYSAKAHPELGEPLRITYCTNHEDFWQMAARQDLYFPRFVTVDQEP